MPTPKKTREQKLAKLTPEQEAEIQAISSRAIADFEGQLDDLERAIGLLHMGHHFGWRTLVLIPSKRTIRKYESILGIVVRVFFPAEGRALIARMGSRSLHALITSGKRLAERPRSRVARTLARVTCKPLSNRRILRAWTRFMPKPFAVY